MESNISIQEIVLGCQNQDAKYQRALVNRYADLLYALCIRYVKDRDFAKDVLQESLLRVFNNIAQFDFEKGTFKGWVKTITVRHCLKKLSAKKIHFASIDCETTREIGVEAEVIGQLNAEDLLVLVHALPEGYRAVFNLSVIDGYSHSEIGEMLEMETASSRSRLSRAKAILREKIYLLQAEESWEKTI